MPLKQLGEFASGQVSAAARAGVWSDWLVERSGFVVRDLTPVVQSLTKDNVPFLLTSREATVSDAARVKVETRPVYGSRNSVPQSATPSLLKAFQESGPLANHTIVTPGHPTWAEGRDADPMPPTPTRLYSLYVEVPCGLVWEITSEYFDPEMVPGAKISAVDTRPCDQVLATSLRWKTIT